MLGEYYERSLFRLWKALFRIGALSAGPLQVDEFLHRTQIYVRLHDSVAPTRRSLLDSHHLFTSAFGTVDPILEYDNAIFHPSPSTSSSCRCFRRLFFCGYSHEYNATEDVACLDPAGSVQAATSSSKQPKSTEKQLHSEFRDFLRRRVILENPSILQDIERYRRSLLLDHVISQYRANNEIDVLNEVSNVDKYKIVGLAQRTSRRRWLDLPMVIETLRPVLLKNKILLVVVNVEDADFNAREQAIRHGALDALIGIHGAQLTEAVWMKPYSLIIELLPYVPNGTSNGDWAKNTHKPTPLGIIFEGTDLQHVGFPLERDSAPYCYNQTSRIVRRTRATNPSKNAAQDIKCWRSTKHRWDERDFLLPPEKVEMMIRRFILWSAQNGGTLFLDPRAQTCNDYLLRGGDEFVLYNINCRGNTTSADNGTKSDAITARHFFHAQSSSQIMTQKERRLKSNGNSEQ